VLKVETKVDKKDQLMVELKAAQKENLLDETMVLLKVVQMVAELAVRSVVMMDQLMVELKAAQKEVSMVSGLVEKLAD